MDGHAFTPERTRVAEAGVQAAFLKSRLVTKMGTIADRQRYGVVALFFHATLQRRDVDNMLKLILDALNGLAWEDDTQVSEISGRKTHCPKGHERTEVVIYELPESTAGTAPCCVCGEVVRVYESTRSQNHYCSQECFRARPGAYKPRFCAVCGIEVQARYRKFCSDECKRQGKRVIQPCEQCGADVERFKSWSKNGRPFCNQECRSTYWREHRSSAARGTCTSCGGHTSKRSYTRCRSCVVEGRVA